MKTFGIVIIISMSIKHISLLNEEMTVMKIIFNNLHCREVSL